MTMKVVINLIRQETEVKKEKLPEAEVSLRIALYYIKNKLTDSNVSVSIDGAHVKTGNQIHFNIQQFMREIGATQIVGEAGKWQGTYSLPDTEIKLLLHSKPGNGDVIIHLINGKTLLIESKKGGFNSSKGNPEYPLMREAIGQLVTGGPLIDKVILAVAVPYSEKSYDLATRWSKYPQIQMLGIKFLLVNKEGNIIEI